MGATEGKAMMPNSQFREPESPRKMVAWSIVIVVAASVLFLLYWPGPAHGPSPKVLTLIKLKQVGTSTAMYEQDHDDRLPPDTSSVRASAPSLRPYWKNDDIMVSLNPGSPEFLGNGSMAAVKVSAVPHQGEIILYFDSAPWVDKRRCVLRVDTSARRILESDFQAAVAHGWTVPVVKL